jgi:hypothetical protein
MQLSVSLYLLFSFTIDNFNKGGERMFPFTTGTIPNSGGTVLLVTVTNTSTAGEVIEIELFSVLFAGAPQSKTGIIHELVFIPANMVISRGYNITGVSAYELEVAVSSTNVVVDSVAASGAGQLASERVLNTELTPITALTPLP